MPATFVLFACRRCGHYQLGEDDFQHLSRACARSDLDRVVTIPVDADPADDPRTYAAGRYWSHQRAR